MNVNLLTVTIVSHKAELQQDFQRLFYTILYILIYRYTYRLYYISVVFYLNFNRVDIRFSREGRKTFLCPRTNRHLNFIHHSLLLTARNSLPIL